MEDYNFDLYSRFGKNFWYVKSRHDLLKRILKKEFGKRKNLKILDAGCGTGFNFEALKEFGEVYGVDVNRKALKQCTRKYSVLKLADINSLRYKDYFDVIIAFELIEHIKDDVKTIRKFREYLKGGGLLILTTPAFKFLWSQDDELAHHERRYAKKGLKRIIERGGFAVEYLGFRYFLFFLPSLAVFTLQKFRKRRNSLEFTPKPLNSLLTRIMIIENWLIAKGIKLVFGVGLICIAKKR